MPAIEDDVNDDDELDELLLGACRCAGGGRLEDEMADEVMEKFGLLLLLLFDPVVVFIVVPAAPVSSAEPFEWMRAICETFVSVELFVVLLIMCVTGRLDAGPFTSGDASNMVICGGLTILTTVVSLLPPAFEFVVVVAFCCWLLVEFIMITDSSL